MKMKTKTNYYIILHYDFLTRLRDGFSEIPKKGNRILPLNSLQRKNSKICRISGDILYEYMLA